MMGICHTIAPNSLYTAIDESVTYIFGFKAVVLNARETIRLEQWYWLTACRFCSAYCDTLTQEA